MEKERKKVVIIGGGITGLAATYYLQKECKEKNLPVDSLLIEASHRLGGKIQTYTDNGYVIEKGPDSFLARKQSASRLAKEVGLENQLVRNSTGKSYILIKDKLYGMPGGAIMGIPTKIMPFALSGMFSPVGKLRAAGDFLLPRSNNTGDQSLGHFFRRRFGNEVVDHLIEPLLSGIYAGDIDQMSLLATFPQFYDVEQKHRSLILGMKKNALKTRSNKSDKEGLNKRKGGMFQSLTSGLESLVTAIENKLKDGSVRKGVAVEHVVKKEKQYLITLSNGQEIFADSIIVCIPHQQVARIFSDYTFFEPFKSIPSTSVANVALAFPESAVKNDIDGTGFIISRDSGYAMTAVTWTHKKWPHSTPKGKALLRCYVGRPGNEEIVHWPDDKIVQTVLKELNKTMNIVQAPELSVITRWEDSMPQYVVGHKQRMQTIKEKMKTNLPGVFLSGASYEGLGVPDCIDQGEKAVQKVITYMYF